ncbi:MAG: c-type cytochrome [Actinobacteria bacterium]|nr:MAG: c-type cytochrome [Actinomycetota bacterium]
MDRRRVRDVRAGARRGDARDDRRRAAPAPARAPHHAGGGRVRSPLLALAAAACATLALLQFAGAGEGSPPRGGSPARAGAAASATSSEAAAGHALFVSSCAACHGLDANGIYGRGPDLHGVGALAADFYLQTGRMPLPSPRAQPLRATPALPQAQIRALVAYVASLGGPPVPVVQPRRGSLARGQQLFALDCAGCHTIQGQGGIVTGAIAPSLGPATPTQLAEAIRIGPYVMPRFSSGELSDSDVDSIARYVQSTNHPEDRGGWGIGRIGPIPEGMVAWLLAIFALLLIVRLIGERAGP